MAGLPPVVESLDKVAEPLRQFYEQKDGKYQVILDAAPPGFVSAADHAVQLGKVVEFRDNNVKLMKEVEELRPIKVKVEGLDIDAAKKALTEVEELKKKGVTKPDDISALVTSAVTAAVKPLEEKIASSDALLAAERKRADDQTLRSTVGEKFNKVGGIASALDFIVSKATDAFEVRDGRVVAKANKFSSVKPGDPLDVDEWLGVQMKETDFAFKPSTGGGSEGSRGSGGGSGLKPGQTELRDPTPAQLGEFSKDILAGKMKVVYSNAGA
jgi:hypothetical protein